MSHVHEWMDVTAAGEELTIRRYVCSSCPATREEPVPAPITDLSQEHAERVAEELLDIRKDLDEVQLAELRDEWESLELAPIPPARPMSGELVPQERLSQEDAEHVVALLRPAEWILPAAGADDDEILKLSGELGGEITSRDQSSSFVNAQRRVASRPEILMSGYHGGPVEPLPLPSPASVLRLFLRGLPAVLRELLEDAQYHAAYEEREHRRRRAREESDDE